MTFTREELEHEYREMPDPQTVNYRRRSGSSTIASGQDVEFFERRNPSWKDMQANKQFISETTLIWLGWRVPIETVFGSGVKPIKGDRLVHSGELWVVQTIKEELLGNRFRLFCTKGKL